MLLQKLHLEQFKGFSEFDLTFNEKISVLVGPNNAGKTTIVSALRLCAALLDHARRRNPGDASALAVGRRRAYTITAAATEAATFTTENILHEFRLEDPILALDFDNGAQLRAEWLSAKSTPPPGYFTLSPPAGTRSTGTRLTAEAFPRIGVVPTLTPAEGRENQLTERRVGRNYTTRLASSHFRNQLWTHYQAGRWSELEQFILASTPEMNSIRLELDEDKYLDMYYVESSSGHERELTWAGDGLQVWLQVLFHIWRERDKDCLVLDEPDVYLHPDLQRRLVGIIRDCGKQVVIATHSMEVLAEIGPDASIAIDRTTDGAYKMTNVEAVALGDFAGLLGSGIQFGFARALTRPVTLFVEGDDQAILKILAGTLGAVRMKHEQGLGVVPIGGFGQWASVDGFARIIKRAGGGLKIFVVLDRDYHSPETINDVEKRLRAQSVVPHVWQRKELENYLVHPEAVARVSGVDSSDVQTILNAALASMEEDTFYQMIGDRQKESERGIDLKTVAEKTGKQFKRDWKKPERQIELVGGKQLIKVINRMLMKRGGKTLSAHKLASALLPDEIPQEMRSLIEQVEAALAPRGVWLPHR